MAVGDKDSLHLSVSPNSVTDGTPGAGSFSSPAAGPGSFSGEVGGAFMQLLLQSESKFEEDGLVSLT